MRRRISWQVLVSRLHERGIIYCLLHGIRRLVCFTIRPWFYLLRVRFVSVFVERMGHLACEADCFIKEGLLKMRPRYCGVLLGPADRVANVRLFEYWNKYFKVIKNPLICWFLAPLNEDECLRFDVERYVGALNRTALHPMIQAKWAGRPPLLSLSDADREHGRHCLQRLGVPRDAWFVCIHCREAGYVLDDVHDCRNANIQNYFLAMQTIVARGGWCIRIGDRSMRSIPAMHGVIDYAHLDVKSDWMDLFLLGECRFLLGTPSGPAGVAGVFAVPFAAVDFIPMSAMPHGINDIGIPKLMFSREEERFLTFDEVLGSDIGNYRFSHLYEEARLTVVENSPEDIRDVALEMLERTQDKIHYSVEDERLQFEFKRLLRDGHYSYGTRARIGRDFLRKHAWLLPIVGSQNLGQKHYECNLR